MSQSVRGRFSVEIPSSSYGKLTTELAHSRKAPTHHTLPLVSYLCTCAFRDGISEELVLLPAPLDCCCPYSVISHPQMLNLVHSLQKSPSANKGGKVSATPLPWDAQSAPPPWPSLSVMLLVGPPLWFELKYP